MNSVEKPTVIDNPEADSIGEVTNTVKESDVSQLVQKTVKNEQEAYDLYNDYAFLLGFSIRRDKQRKRSNKTDLSMKQYCCSKEGHKKSKSKGCYRKRDTRIGCKAHINFDIDEKGVYTVTKHDMVHNHPLCPEDKQHLLRSHRNVRKQDIEYLLILVDSGVKLSDAIRVLNKEKGGSPIVGFTPQDAYNQIASEKKKRIDGADANALIQESFRRKETEKDFYFDYQKDDEGHLVNFYWRDAHMKKLYELFGDLLIHDTTHRTNRYELICGPFVGMNHHGRNIMFGCGFISDEKTESFNWLFKTFLTSMGGKQPVTIMTDQCFAMIGAIESVFTNSSHGLCVWHISENSKKNIPHLRSVKGFTETFDHVCKYVETEAEFDLYWKRLLSDYQCSDNKWLERLHLCRKKWCPVFSKEKFSGGILSSQRSESTNHSISSKLYATAGLYDVYNCIVDVVNEWQSKTKGEDFNYINGKPEMIEKHIDILAHAREVYTTEPYRLFEEQFLKTMTLHQYLQQTTCEDTFIYHVGKAKDLIKHVVTFNSKEKTVTCTCNTFLEAGILCSHSLRIMNIHNVDTLPENYILRRWTKEAISILKIDEQHTHLPENPSISTAVWRTQLIRKFNELISTSESNKQATEYLEEAYLNVKKKVDELTSMNLDEAESTQSEIGNTVNVKNPTKSRQNGERNKRKQSTREKITNIVRGKKAKQFRATNYTKATAQASIQAHVNTMTNGGYFVHPVDGGQYLIPVMPNVVPPFAQQFPHSVSQPHFMPSVPQQHSVPSIPEQHAGAFVPQNHAFVPQQHSSNNACINGLGAYFYCSNGAV